MERLHQYSKTTESEIELLKIKKINKIEKENSNPNEYFIHNYRKFRNGVAMIKNGENKFNRDTIIQKYRYDTELKEGDGNKIFKRCTWHYHWRNLWFKINISL